MSSFAGGQERLSVKILENNRVTGDSQTVS